MTPEEKARNRIDRQLADCDWAVQDFRELNISASLGVAVRKFPLATGEADYLLYADGKAIAVVEAKPEGHPLIGVEPQSEKYKTGLPPNLPHYHLPLPFAYESTGSETRFTNALEPHARCREVFAFHRPEELIRPATVERQVRALLREMPEIAAQGSTSGMKFTASRPKSPTKARNWSSNPASSCRTATGAPGASGTRNSTTTCLMRRTNSTATL
jgi:type I restriction enzyme, R subunit